MAKSPSDCDKIKTDALSAVQTCDKEIADLKLELSDEKTLLSRMASERDDAFQKLEKENQRFPGYFWAIVGSAAGAVAAAFILR